LVKMDEDLILTPTLAAYAAFHAAAVALPPRWREQPGACGGWTAREVVRHATGWEAEARARVRAIRATPAAPARTYDDRFHAAPVATRRDLDRAMALAELAVTHAALAALHATIGPDEACNRRFVEWARGRAADFADHTAQLPAWRESRWLRRW
jgi:hypothetical protein